MRSIRNLQKEYCANAQDQSYYFLWLIHTTWVQLNIDQCSIEQHWTCHHMDRTPATTATGDFFLCNCATNNHVYQAICSEQQKKDLQTILKFCDKMFEKILARGIHKSAHCKSQKYITHWCEKTVILWNFACFHTTVLALEKHPNDGKSGCILLGFRRATKISA